MRTLFKGGTVITGRGPKRADVLVEGEKVRQVGRLILTPADRTVDVEGCLLFPGFIDAHTHFDLDVCNTTTADDFTTGSRAALKGGTTTVIDFACPNKGRVCNTVWIFGIRKQTAAPSATTASTRPSTIGTNPSGRSCRRCSARACPPSRCI